ncbi:hypothetical protein PGT21_017336 [Puccinia graminis f. sp. tritici]|uniref:Uncharacterized protein n=1 Tax=Puccinia graminis f. sp. tritici TaxID=56615 RepID=A0A5B0RUX3_PUCGR|nr:hypothetical protein PGT21_017336 [Puccinia graminis f. sp. tritici]KAA1129397.1 hypothetical protein PGTUg99_031903 [Puccinia graminis f. sp. tritici]
MKTTPRPLSLHATACKVVTLSGMDEHWQSTQSGKSWSHTEPASAGSSAAALRPRGSIKSLDNRFSTQSL